MSLGQVFFIVNLYFTCPNEQVVIKTYVASSNLLSGKTEMGSSVSADSNAWA